MTTSQDYLNDLMLDRSELDAPLPYLILWIATEPMAEAMASWPPALEMTATTPEVLRFGDRTGVRYEFSDPDRLVAYVDRMNEGGLPGSGSIEMTGGQAAGLTESEFAALRSTIGSPAMFGLNDMRTW